MRRRSSQRHHGLGRRRARVRVAERHAPVEWRAGDSIPLHGEPTVIRVHRVGATPDRRRGRSARADRSRRPSMFGRPSSSRFVESPPVSWCRGFASSRPAHGLGRGAGHHPQPAVALGIVFTARHDRAELQAGADAARGLRLRPAPRADAPAPAESLAPLFGGWSSGVPGLPRSGTMAPGGRKGALLMLLRRRALRDQTMAHA